MKNVCAIKNFFNSNAAKPRLYIDKNERIKHIPNVTILSPFCIVLIARISRECRNSTLYWRSFIN